MLNINSKPKLTEYHMFYSFISRNEHECPALSHRFDEPHSITYFAMQRRSVHAGKFRPRIAHETGTGIWHLSHLARAARCDDDFFRFLAPFFGIYFSLTSLKFGMEQARGKPLVYVFE